MTRKDLGLIVSGVAPLLKRLADRLTALEGKAGLGARDGRDGVNGERGADGIGISTASVAADGRLMLSLTNGVVVDAGSVKGDRGSVGDVGPVGPVGPEGRTGQKGETGATGDVGPAGPKGDTGRDGKDGASFKFGDGPPKEAGNPGDGYLDLETGMVYQWR